TRMKINSPKALVPALGKPLLDYVVEATLKFASDQSLRAQIGVVVGQQREQLEEWRRKNPSHASLELAWQKEEEGTADALKSCFHDLPHFWNNEFTLVACADTPMISPEEFAQMFKEFKLHPDLSGVAATFEACEPTGYGRII